MDSLSRLSTYLIRHLYTYPCIVHFQGFWKRNSIMCPASIFDKRQCSKQIFWYSALLFYGEDRITLSIYIVNKTINHTWICFCNKVGFLTVCFQEWPVCICYLFTFFLDFQEYFIVLNVAVSNVNNIIIIIMAIMIITASKLIA